MAGEEEKTGTQLMEMQVGDVDNIKVADTAVSPNGIWNTWTTQSWETPHMGGEMQFRATNLGRGNIGPRLCFKYMKTKMNALENKFFRRRMKNLEKMAEEYAKTGQVAMQDECIKQYIIIARESAILACGFKYFITEEHVEKFSSMCKTDLHITQLKNFARVLPKKVVKMVKKVREKQLFDDYVVFHLDNKAKKETAQEKREREKDPVLFGKIAESDRYHFIIDWEDEMDNLRFNDIIKKISLTKKDLTLKTKI